MSNEKYCPKCGTEITEAGRFCASCGAELSQPEPDAASSAETIKMVVPHEPPPPAGPTPPQGPSLASGGPSGPSGNFPWKRVLPIALACVLLAAGAGVALASFTDLGKATRSSAGSTWTNPNTTTSTDTGTTTKPSTTKTSTTRTQTTRTQTNGTAQTYINTMDRLIAENDRLETQIVTMADQINRVAPGGITDQMLSDIDQLGILFLGINTEADGLDTPAAFGTSTRDFKQLTSYNMDRCNALYGGALAWRSGQPYSGYFSEGQTAKDSYYSLYPFFIQEFEAAKATGQR